MARSRRRPTTRYAMAARPQLASAFLVAASAPSSLKTPLPRENTPRSTASAASSTKRTRALSRLASSAMHSAPTARNSAHTTASSQTTWAMRTRIEDVVADSRCTAVIGRSPALEPRLAGAVLHERPHADGAVLGGEQCGELLALDLQAGLQVHLEAAVDGLLGRPQGVRRRADELAGPRHRLVEDGLRREDPVDEPDRQRLVGLD